MSKRAVCVGINDYPGTDNDLKGCVNDARDWANLLEEVYGFTKIKAFHDAQATRDGILTALDDLIGKAKPGDILAFTYSGHGTWVYDRGERDESDNRDEALCAYDGIIIDDELRDVIGGIDPEVFLTIISDSCHSGTVTRSRLRRERAHENARVVESAPRIRYMPPEKDEDALRTGILPIRKRILYPEATMPTMLLTGCNAYEYSYDANIGGRYNGAMTTMAVHILLNEPDLTYRQFHQVLRQLLPSTRYPQSPQCEGSDANKDRKVFS